MLLRFALAHAYDPVRECRGTAKSWILVIIVAGMTLVWVVVFFLLVLLLILLLKLLSLDHPSQGILKLEKIRPALLVLTSVVVVVGLTLFFLSCLVKLIVKVAVC